MLALLTLALQMSLPAHQCLHPPSAQMLHLRSLLRWRSLVYASLPTTRCVAPPASGFGHSRHSARHYGAPFLSGKSVFAKATAEAPAQTSTPPVQPQQEPMALPTSDESPELLRIRHSVSDAASLPAPLLA